MSLVTFPPRGYSMMLMMLNDDDGLPNLKGMRNRLLKIQTFITDHYIILTNLLYRVRTLTSHDTEESENSSESPHLGEIKRMRKQCVPGASRYSRAPGSRLVAILFSMKRGSLRACANSGYQALFSDFSSAGSVHFDPILDTATLIRFRSLTLNWMVLQSTLKTFFSVYST